MFTEEDKYGLYAKIIFKYFMAEGVVTSQPILVASQDHQPSQFLSELPAVINDSECHTKPVDNEKLVENEQMKIAWRYQNMKLVDSSPAEDHTFGHFYDLTKSMQSDLLEHADIKQWHESNLQEQNNIFENEEMSRHLRKLLHSKDPYDLQTANRLIKVMVKEVRFYFGRIFEIGYHIYTYLKI